MKYFRLIFPVLLIFLFSNCKSSIDEVFQKRFDKINESLETSSSDLNDSIDGIYKQIVLKNSSNSNLTVIADSIYYHNLKTCSFLDSLKQVMLDSDALDEDLDAASHFFSNPKIASELKSNLLNVYYSVHVNLMDSASQKELSDLMQNFKEIEVNKHWIKNYFDSIPMIAAITILSKFINDCNKISIIALKSINNQL